MKTCTTYGCTAPAPRNSEICFEHIKEGLMPTVGVQAILDRGAGTISVTSNTDEPIVAEAIIWTEAIGAMLEQTNYLNLLAARFFVNESAMKGNRPYTGKMDLKCR